MSRSGAEAHAAGLGADFPNIGGSYTKRWRGVIPKRLRLRFSPGSGRGAATQKAPPATCMGSGWTQAKAEMRAALPSRHRQAERRDGVAVAVSIVVPGAI